MTEVVEPASSRSHTPSPLITERPTVSRPLSELSENSERLNNISRTSMPSLLEGGGNNTNGTMKSRPNSEVNGNGKPSSRPQSEVRDESSPTPSASTGAKRLSTPGIHTITVNLMDYAAAVAGPKTPVSAVSASSSSTAPPPPSPSTKPAKPEKPAGLVSRPTSGSASKGKEVDVEASRKGKESGLPKASDNVDPLGHPLLVAKRASLRPSPLGTSSTTDLKPIPSPPSGQTSFESTRSADSLGVLPNPPPKSTKPSWLRRASGTAAFRSKSKTPPPKEEGGSIPASTSLPPELPPRKGKSSSLMDRAGEMSPPEIPPRSYANAAAGPSRSRLGGGEGQPAYSPTLSSHPSSKESVGNIRGRLAAWTNAAGSNATFSRSESSASLASTASGAFNSAQQKLPATAQKFMGQAGSAVSKGWAGLRARGVGGSISNISALGVSGRRGSIEPGGSRPGRVSKERSVSANVIQERGDGPLFDEGVILRAGGTRTGRVFGRDITESGKAWGVVDAGQDIEGQSEWDKRRRAVLPAVIVRAVDYLEIWGPKEEGIFRISGRSSHVARLRKEFDSGADLDLRDCHPGDLDPHAVAGVFKSYLRELPVPILTHSLSPKFESAVKDRGESNKEDNEDFGSLLERLPIAHWFLLADIVNLLDLIPRHTATNRMTLNAVVLSLGPSLNIPGAVLTELLERRQELFATPPPEVDGNVVDLIDFGDVMISPPTLPQKSSEQISRAVTPTSFTTIESSIAPEGKKKTSPKLPTKASFTRLFANSAPNTRAPSSRKSSMDALRSSSIDLAPPRVDVGLESPRLPSFESDTEGRDLGGQKTENLRDSIIESPKPVEDAKYPVGTVEDRILAFSTSTPIADMYASSSTALPSLRKPKSSTTSLNSFRVSPSLPVGISEGNSPNLRVGEWGTSISAPINPASVVRRGGQPAFFQSGSGGSHSHGRSRSMGGPLSLPSTTVAPVAASTSGGVKRKDDSPIEKSGGEDDNRVKRLSAGPGTLVKDANRGMEMMA